MGPCANSLTKQQLKKMKTSLGRIKDELQPNILDVIILHKHDFWLNILTPKSEGF